jgi:hypothetical protein
MRSRSRLLSVVALAAVAAALLAATARADGDPASDYLIGQSVFAPYDKNIPTADAGRLTLLVGNAKSKGFRIKVALVGVRSDLGAVTSLWRQPQRYAQFLSQELFFVYRGTLLIVMPNGYGIAKRGKPDPADAKTLRRLAPPVANLPAAATVAVRALAKARGIELAIPTAPSTGSRNNHDRISIVVGVVAALLVAGAFVLVRRRIERRRTVRGEEAP